MPIYEGFFPENGPFVSFVPIRKIGVGTRFSESRKDAGKHGKVLFQLFWNKLEQTGTGPAILGVRPLPPPMRSGCGQKII